jgi:hypothetical protein
MESTVDLGIVAIEAAPGWNFYPMDRWVVGRPASRVGVFIVSTEQRDAVTPPATHETCMAAAKAVSGYPVGGMTGFDRARDLMGQCLAGGESFRADSDFVRIWYHRCPPGLVVAWFACPADRENEPLVKDHIKECEKMILSLELPPPMA